MIPSECVADQIMGKKHGKHVTQGVKPFKTRRYASLGGRDDLQMAGSFTQENPHLVGDQSVLSMQRSNIFLESLCHILPHPKKPESGTFGRQDWCREQEFGLVEVDCVVCAFMMFQEKWADMNLWACLRITQLAFESKIWITLSFQDLTCFFDYTIAL